MEIIDFQGDVQVKKTKTDDFSVATAGLLLPSGATIKTGAASFAQLGFDDQDDAIVRVEENTTAVILLKNDEKIELLEGEVFSIIRNLSQGQQFAVRTPTAVIGARGTEWGTKYTNETTEVEAYDDEPFVRHIDEQGNVSQEEVKVKAGTGTEVKRHQKPSNPRPVTAERQQRWQHMRTDIRQKTEQVRQQRGRPQRSLNPVQQQKGNGGSSLPEGRKSSDQPLSPDGPNTPGQHSQGSERDAARRGELDGKNIHSKDSRDEDMMRVSPNGENSISEKDRSRIVPGSERHPGEHPSLEGERQRPYHDQKEDEGHGNRPKVLESMEGPQVDPENNVREPQHQSRGNYQSKTAPPDRNWPPQVMEKGSAGPDVGPGTDQMVPRHNGPVDRPGNQGQMRPKNDGNHQPSSGDHSSGRRSQPPQHRGGGQRRN